MKNTKEFHMQVITPEQPDPWPLDVSRLVKGQSITPAECREIVGKCASQDEYRFKLMALQARIMEDSAYLGNPLSARIDGDGIHINTDAEASEHHAGLAERHERGIYRHVAHLARTVDANKLTDHQRAEHERQQRVWALKCARLRSGGVTELPPPPPNIGGPAGT